MAEPWKFALGREGLERQLMDGVTARILAGEHVMLSHVTIPPGTTTVVHHHDEEQWGVLLEGRCVRIQGGEEVAMGPGDCWHTPGGVDHGIRTGDEGVVILDIFGPPRPEYRKAGSGFGGGH